MGTNSVVLLPLKPWVVVVRGKQVVVLDITKFLKQLIYNRSNFGGKKRDFCLAISKNCECIMFKSFDYK